MKPLIFAAIIMLAGCATGPESRNRVLMGEWDCVSAVVDGNALPEKTVQQLHLSLTPTRFTTKKGDEVLFDSTYRVNAAATPRQIFMVGTEGELTGKEARGIYTFEGDQLVLCYAMPGDAMPTKFESATGSKAYLTLWRPTTK